MQTKHHIQQLLSSAGVFPKKRLGQHFLVDLNLMRLLVDSANIRNTDVVLEVGCGTGSLTEALARQAARVIAVEIDKTLTEIAKTELDQAKNIEIINADILKNKSTINPVVIDALKCACKKYTGRILLVANLPYSSASPLMLNLLTGPVAADGMYVTIQKQVADRMMAAPGSSEYGTLSIYLAATGDVKLIRVLKPTVFWPQPQVDSAMVRFVRDKDKIAHIRDMKLLSEVINLFMRHRRKMIRVCTKFAHGQFSQITNWPQIFQRCSIDPTQHPEQLSADNYVALANFFYDYLKQK